jgi:hypothetical protein
MTGAEMPSGASISVRRIHYDLKHFSWYSERPNTTIATNDTIGARERKDRESDHVRHVRRLGSGFCVFSRS